jgi:signal transduction histidine kinase
MNAYKHAQATHILVRLIFEQDSVTVVIQDNGVGLSQHVIERYADDPAHFGLRTIARQIEELDGTFEVMNGEESGTIVRATVPVKQSSEEALYDRASAN